jgi:hypothetical protein
MSDYRPLSSRDVSNEHYDVLREGLPSYLHEPTVAWLGQFLRSHPPMGGVHYHVEWTYGLQLHLQLEPPLAGAEHDEDSAAVDDLLGRIRADEELALNVLDYALYSMRDFDVTWARHRAAQLNAVLDGGNSAWQAVEVDGVWRLERRAVGPVRESIEEVGSTSNRANRHLQAARTKLASRDVDPTGAYREAVRAVEAIAKPVFLPNDQRATLGKMIAELRDHPERWETTIGTSTDTMRQMEMVWKGQHDRHGTDDPSMPIAVSPEEAWAAFATSLMLVQWFAGGHVRRASGQAAS